MSVWPWFSVVVGFVVAAGVTRWLAVSPHAPRLVDVPNHRSLHERPTPRSGGLGIWAGVLAAVALASAGGVSLPDSLPWLGAACALLAVVSLLDDVRPLSPLPRIGAHFVAAGVLVVAGIAPAHLALPGMAVALPAPLAVVVTLLFTVWMANLYNFMDGMDGFAGGMTLFGFGGFALLGWLGGDAGYALFALLLAVAAGGFLLSNFPPARIFMGDAGSVPLGFMAAALTLIAERDGLFAWWVGVLVFSPFVVDATLTLARRAMRGERVWQAHRSHYYQRLVQMGWSHRRTVLGEYALMSVCVLAALLATLAPVTGPAIGGIALVGYTALAVSLSRRWAKRGGGSG